MIKYASCLLYADDLKLFKVVRNVRDCSAIQRDLDANSDWCHRNMLQMPSNFIPPKQAPDSLHLRHRRNRFRTIHGNQRFGRFTGHKHELHKSHRKHHCQGLFHARIVTVQTGLSPWSLFRKNLSCTRYDAQ